ncbi:MAG: hypothetical protein ACRCZF_04985, partial [Gemmataceae bacterium]
MFRVTHALWVGRFPTLARVAELQRRRLTHVLNVSDAASVIVAGEAGIVQVIDEPLSDQHRIPEAR